MILRPFFPYYGSKWSLARLYPAPRYDRIVEPFAGSACYSLHYPQRDVVLIERDPVIAGLWRWLIGASADEILALPDLAPGQSTDDLDVRDEVRALIGFWCNNGVTAPRKRMTLWDGGRGFLQWGPKVRRRIARQLPAIRHWHVIEGCHDELPPAWNPPATWFVDPPYQGRPGSHYRYGSKLIDYSELRAWCQGLPGQVVVCEQQGAGWLPFERVGRVQGQRGASAEVVWCSDRRDRMSWLQPGLFGGDET